MAKKTRIRLPKFYRNIAAIFFGSTIILAAVIFHSIYGSAKIIITPAFQKVSDEAMVRIQAEPGKADEKDGFTVQGKLYEFLVNESVSVGATGEKIVFGDTVGTLEIINNYSRDQALVATTRLVAPDGTLVRLKDKVTVPRGGRVQAQVYPDAPESFRELEPTKFIIPGLFHDLQDKIFAQSKDTLRKGGAKITVISEQDMNTLEKKILEIIDGNAQESAQAKLTGAEALYTRLFQKEILRKDIAGAVGEERGSVDAQFEARVYALVFDELRVVGLMKKELSSGLSLGKELKELDPKSIIYTIDKFDPEAQSAAVKVYAEGKAAVKSGHNIFDKSKILAKRPEEAAQYYKSFPEVQNVEIELRPKWLKRLPRFENKIEIVVQ